MDEQRECRTHGTRHIGVRPICVKTGSSVSIQASFLISAVRKITIHTPQKVSPYVLSTDKQATRIAMEPDRKYHSVLGGHQQMLAALPMQTHFSICTDQFLWACLAGSTLFALDISEHYLTCISDRVICPSIPQSGASRAHENINLQKQTHIFVYKDNQEVCTYCCS